MAAAERTGLSDYDRLKQINTELGGIASQRKACRMKISIFGALGGMLLSASVISVFHNLLNSSNDWAKNPDSPVHLVVSQDISSFKIPVPVGAGGIILGLGLFLFAKTRCSLENRLSNQEWELVAEMRRLRDKMYPHDIEKHDHRRFAPPDPDHTVPLNPDTVRGEYVGLYSPPGSHKTAVSG